LQAADPGPAFTYFSSPSPAFRSTRSSGRRPAGQSGTRQAVLLGAQPTADLLPGTDYFSGWWIKLRSLALSAGQLTTLEWRARHTCAVSHSRLESWSLSPAWRQRPGNLRESTEKISRNTIKCTNPWIWPRGNRGAASSEFSTGDLLQIYITSS
jgi:hypothetical protein